MVHAVAVCTHIVCGLIASVVIIFLHKYDFTSLAVKHDALQGCDWSWGHSLCVSSTAMSNLQETLNIAEAANLLPEVQTRDPRPCIVRGCEGGGFDSFLVTKLPCWEHRVNVDVVGSTCMH